MSSLEEEVLKYVRYARASILKGDRNFSDKNQGDVRIPPVTSLKVIKACLFKVLTESVM
jgi:hypothetical protein